MNVNGSQRVAWQAWIMSTLREAAFAPLLVFIAYAIAAKGFDAYLTYPWLDMPTHFLGGLAITWFYRVGIRHVQAVVGHIPPPVQPLLALGLTALTAIAWEFWEFAADSLMGTHMNLGVADTLSDLFFGLTGGLVATTLSVKRREPGTDPGSAF